MNVRMDIVFALGGDGTLLSFLRTMYNFYSHVDLPDIAAFNYGSMGYLCNFKQDDVFNVLNNTVFKTHLGSDHGKSLSQQLFHVPKDLAIDKKLRLHV